jgi:5-methylthioadenosine/S-adenosylhomocysteine deaminase
MQKVDLLIFGGKVLTLDEQDSIIDPGDVAIRGDTILEIGQNLAAKYISSQVVDARGKLVMPGLVNAHTHAAMTLFRGLADDLGLMDWLQNHIFPAESRFMNADNVYLGTLLACIEMIKSGTTTLSDGYFFEADAARAVRDAGLRGIMAEGIVDFPSPDMPDPQKRLDLAEEFICQWKGSDRVKPGLFCHSAYTCCPKTLQETKKMARKYDIPFGIHLAETQTEIQEVMRQYGNRPVKHLADLGILDETVMAVHCVWLDPEEIDLLHKFQVKVVHSPESNMKLASGIAPIPELLQRGITVGLGTDGCASNNDLDLFQEMDTAAKLHKVARFDPTVLTARQVVRMATMGGAEALGLAGSIGSLEAGKKADVIVIDLQKPHLVPLYNLYSHLVYTLNGADVNSVVVNGTILMRDRKLLHLEEEPIMERVIDLARGIQKNQRA